MKQAGSTNWIDTVPIYWARACCSICFREVEGLYYEGVNYYGATATVEIFEINGKPLCKWCEWWSEIKHRFETAEKCLAERRNEANRGNAGRVLSKEPHNDVAKGRKKESRESRLRKMPLPPSPVPQKPMSKRNLEIF